MRLFDWLTFGGIEVANTDRVRVYLEAGLMGTFGQALSGCEDCEHALLEYEDVYNLPGEGDTPWSDDDVAASADFLGILPQRIDLQSVIGRTMTLNGNGGGKLSRQVLRPRVLTFQGLMLARSPEGMIHGDNWLNEVLHGSRCAEGCEGDEVCYLPACPPIDLIPADTAFRRLVSVGLTDGPTTQPLRNFPESKIQQVSFQLASESPYKFGFEQECTEEVVDDYDGVVCCMMTATEWADSVVVITITAEEAATDVHVFARRAVNDFCPEDEGEKCWEATIPAMVTGDVVTFDGVREQVFHRSPALKSNRSGLRMLEPNGPVCFPTVGPCQSLCICVQVGSGTVNFKVDTVVREV